MATGRAPLAVEVKDEAMLVGSIDDLPARLRHQTRKTKLPEHCPEISILGRSAEDSEHLLR